MKRNKFITHSFTPEDIAKMTRKNITADSFFNLAELDNRSEYGKRIIEKVNNMDHGEFLAAWFNKKNNKWYRLHLKSIWFKPFTLNYSCHQKIKKGKEILISNHPLPKGDVIKR